MNQEEFVVYKGEKIPIVLDGLDLSCSNIEDLGNVEGLSDCVNLVSLDLSGNPLKEIKGLENLQ